MPCEHVGYNTDDYDYRSRGDGVIQIVSRFLFTNLTSDPEDKCVSRTTKALGFAADYSEKANTTVNENDLLHR